jgi:hypothetical protein
MPFQVTLNKELAIPRDGDEPEYARVTKHLRDKDGLPIGASNGNPILDMRLNEVEYIEGHKASLAADAIIENMFAQVDDVRNVRGDRGSPNGRIASE